MSSRKNRVTRALRQRPITEYVEAKIPKSSEIVYEVKELPLSFKSGAIFAFDDIESTEFTHGMHAYPAKFVPQIPRWATRYADLNSGDILLDPFCGCGTTLVEASVMGFNSYGIDVNPMARLLTKVKSTPLYLGNPKLLFRASSSLMRRIRKDNSQISLQKQDDVNLHYNWKYWFNEKVMELLIKIKRNIRSFDPTSVKNENEAQDVRDFFLVCLSSIIKKVSYLDEEQIKVKRSSEKLKQGIPNPSEAFEKACQKSIPGMVSFAKKCARHAGITARVIGRDARCIPLEDESVRLIVTSPPYINAIDYPFAHKYELFVLDLIKPKDYRPHSRNYIGVSERVLLKSMYEDLHLSGYEPVDTFIERVYSPGKNVDKNRAYILYQYFTGMQAFLKEARRVLEADGFLIIVVGDNHIRKIYIPTHMLLMRIAEERVGFQTETFFYHKLRRKKFGLPRHDTGGQIKREMAMVLKKG